MPSSKRSAAGNKCSSRSTREAISGSLARAACRRNRSPISRPGRAAGRSVRKRIDALEMVAAIRAHLAAGVLPLTVSYRFQDTGYHRAAAQQAMVSREHGAQPR